MSSGRVTKALPRACAVEPGGLGELGRDRLEPGQEEDGGQRELAPGVNDDHGRHREVGAGQPLDVAVDGADAVEEAVDGAEVAVQQPP